jgi:hypothetical protein
VSSKKRSTRKSADLADVPERQRNPGELAVTKGEMIGPSWAVLLGLLIRHGLRTLIGVLVLRLAVTAAAAAPGEHAAALIKGLFQVAANLMK